MKIQIFINRINKIGRGWPHFVCVYVLDKTRMRSVYSNGKSFLLCLLGL